MGRVYAVIKLPPKSKNDPDYEGPTDEYYSSKRRDLKIVFQRETRAAPIGELEGQRDDQNIGQPE